MNVERTGGLRSKKLNMLRLREITTFSTADHRRDVPDQLVEPQTNFCGFLAGADACPKAEDAHSNCVGDKMARAIWAMLTKKEDYRDPAQLLLCDCDAEQHRLTSVKRA